MTPAHQLLAQILLNDGFSVIVAPTGPISTLEKVNNVIIGMERISATKKSVGVAPNAIYRVKKAVPIIIWAPDETTLYNKLRAVTASAEKLELVQGENIKLDRIDIEFDFDREGNLLQAYIEVHVEVIAGGAV